MARYDPMIKSQPKRPRVECLPEERSGTGTRPNLGVVRTDEGKLRLEVDIWRTGTYTPYVFAFPEPWEEGGWYNEFGCNGCEECVGACPVKAITMVDAWGAIGTTNDVALINVNECVMCGICVEICPVKCIAIIASMGA